MGHNPDWSDDRDFGSDLDPISQEAVTWFAVMNADAVSAADRAAFRAWLRRDVRHQAAYADIERMWSGASHLPFVKQRRRAGRLAVTRRALGKGALAALIGGGAWAVYQQRPFADYRTGTGERRTVTLHDNSTIELAAATALSVDFSAQMRLVTLYHGEAYFAATPDTARPFVVEAGAGRTMAAGTAFNIDYVSHDDVRVTAFERPAEIRLGASAMRLEAGSQVTYGRNMIGAPQEVDPASVLAWRDGRLVFVSRPFGEVITSLNRWRDGRLVVMSPTLAVRPVTLIVDVEKSGDILPTLEATLPIRVVNLSPYMTLIFEA